MAGTPLSSIFDIFMSNVNDYRLVNLYNQSQADFESYVQAFLVSAIGEFDICNQSLVFDDLTKLFTETLTTKNQLVLAELMAKYWLTREVSDVLQFRLHVQDRDFKTFAEANNLQQKLAYLDRQKETCSQLLVDYGYKNNDWNSWLQQSFMGS